MVASRYGSREAADGLLAQITAMRQRLAGTVRSQLLMLDQLKPPTTHQGAVAVERQRLVDLLEILLAEGCKPKVRQTLIDREVAQLLREMEVAS